jgi:hypothetical protein
MCTTKSLMLSFAVLVMIAYFRPPEYDESYSIFLTTAHFHPVWPVGTFTPGQVRGRYLPGSDFRKIVENLRSHDVHPPLYFWCLLVWREVFGAGWFTARLLSVVFAVASLGVVGALAGVVRVPPGRAMLLCLTSYGFAYTGILARNFALADFLMLSGVFLIVREGAGAGRTWAVTVGAGLCLGAATFTNYLTVFPAVVVLGYFLVKCRGRAVPAVLCFALFLPADIYMLAAQHGSRASQFTAFSWPGAVAVLVRDSAAAWFGGLPVYAGRCAMEVIALLVVLAAVAIFYIARNRTGYALVLAMLALATPAGLLGLALMFHNTPVEIRYLALSMPYFALLLAGVPRPIWMALLFTQSLSIVGLAFSPLTAQPEGRAAREAGAQSTPDTLTLLPYGNDGTGIPGAFIEAAPDGLNIRLIYPGRAVDLVGWRRVVLVSVGADAGSREALAETEAVLKGSRCWRETEETPWIRGYVDGCE